MVRAEVQRGGGILSRGGSGCEREYIFWTSLEGRGEMLQHGGGGLLRSQISEGEECPEKKKRILRRLPAHDGSRKK